MPFFLIGAIAIKCCDITKEAIKNENMRNKNFIIFKLPIYNRTIKCIVRLWVFPIVSNFIFNQIFI